MTRFDTFERGDGVSCTACGLPSSYNRAVIDSVDDEVVGCLCTSCIEDFFGRSLELFERRDETCLFCDRRGLYALPKWSCVTIEDDERIDVVGVDYCVDAATPHLCNHHFSELRADDDENPEVPATGSRAMRSLRADGGVDHQF
jgi:hypothetical protein